MLVVIFLTSEMHVQALTLSELSGVDS